MRLSAYACNLSWIYFTEIYHTWSEGLNSRGPAGGRDAITIFMKGGKGERKREEAVISPRSVWVRRLS
jgi:hypothetical protein